MACGVDVAPGPGKPVHHRVNTTSAGCRAERQAAENSRRMRRGKRSGGFVSRQQQQISIGWTTRNVEVQVRRSVELSALEGCVRRRGRCRGACVRHVSARASVDIAR